MKSFPLFGAILLLLTSCPGIGENHTRTDPYILGDIENDICTPLEKQGLKRVYTGPRGYISPTDAFWLTFRTSEYHFESPEAARGFFVKKIQYLLNSYNKAPKLEPFMQGKQVKPADFWIQINLYKDDKTVELPPDLCRLELKDNKISYYRWDPTTKSAQVIFSEPYNEASQMVGKAQLEKLHT